MPESNRPHVVGSVGRYGGLPPVAVLRRPVMDLTTLARGSGWSPSSESNRRETKTGGVGKDVGRQELAHRESATA